MNAQLPLKVIMGTADGNSFPYQVKPVDAEKGPVILLKADIDGKSFNNSQWLWLDCCLCADTNLCIEFRFCKNRAPVFKVWNRHIPAHRLKSCVHFKTLDNSTSFPQQLPCHLKIMSGGKACDIKDIDSIEIAVSSAHNFQSFKVYGLNITDECPVLKIEGDPIVDMFGQYKNRHWKSKTESAEELKAFLKSELKKARSDTDGYADGLDRFGGCKEIYFGKKGYFYTHFDGNRWWLVDPDGNAFFSNGICYGSRTGIHGITDGVENLFDWLPETNDPVFADAYTKAENVPEYKKRNKLGSNRLLFNFARANMIRVFGEKWHDAWVDINTYRLKKWGFNTIGIGVNQYADEKTKEYLNRAKMPYCVTLQNFPKTKTLLFRDFPDVFSQEYLNLCKEYANCVLSFSGDEYFIGYFMTNEPEWMFASYINVAERTFALSALTESKKHLILWLKDRYSNITELNKVWNTSFEDFTQLEQPFADGDKFSPTAEKDFAQMQQILIEKYCKTPTECIRELVPHALNLGLRNGGAHLGGVHSEAKFFDIFSCNIYSAEPAKYFEKVRETVNGPYISGEWHYGSLEGGLLTNASIGAVSQRERGKACAEYLRQALYNSQCVGVHYFEYNDQPLLGRFDGENMQIGLIDVCNRPYYDCIEEFSKINNKMYAIASGKETVDKIEWAQTKKFY